MESAVLRMSVLLGITFVTGFVLGYKAKEWRLRWVKRRRDCLAAKLAKTQKELEMLSVVCLASWDM